MFSCKFCEILKDTFFHRTPPQVAASVVFQKSPWKKNSPGKESLDSEADTNRIGNTLWCSCGKYKLIATHAESICYLDKYENRESYFEDILSPVSEMCLSCNLLVKRKLKHSCARFLFTLNNF